VRETSTVIDDACWKKVWAEMTDSELEDRLFMYLWLSLHTTNKHASQVAQLIAGSGMARPGWDGGKSPREGRGDAGRKGRVRPWVT
jgi:hypothetical protein